MNVVLVFLIILIITIVIVILVHKSGKFDSPDSLTNKSATPVETQSNLPQNAYLPSPAWSQPEPFPTDGSGTAQCLTYTFIAGQYNPAYPSYQALNGSGGRDFLVSSNNTGYVCIDIDQLFASTISHECSNQFSNGAGAGCILTVPTAIKQGESYITLQPGDLAPYGTIEGVPDTNGSEVLYTSCIPGNLSNNTGTSSYCLGSIGVIVPNFTPQNQYDATGSGQNNCLSGDTVKLSTNGYYDTKLLPCDLSNPTEIFRMIRFSLDSSFNLNQDDTGDLASIVHRATGYYLAPQLDPIPIIHVGNSGVDGTPTTTSYYYNFDQPIINYGSITDNFGNIFPTSMKLTLINPSYDTQRNGVYWLLQNQTLDASINPQSANPIDYINQGVYPNQLNYAKNFPKGQSTPSYYWEQTASATGIPVSIANDASQTCLFGTNPNVGSTGVTGISTNIAPQQIVYVPDLGLLPQNSLDPTGIWSYLINQYSINIDSSNQPLLTPYRTGSNVQINYKCIEDTVQVAAGDPVTNYFTVMTNIWPKQGTTQNADLYSDTQFINYAKFVTQIQIGVTANSTTVNSNFRSYSNPFNS